MKRLKNYGEFLVFVANEMGLTDLEKATEEQKSEWRKRVEVAWKYYCIPDKAYDYVVNGKSAIEWIMERYQVKVDKASGIKNDPNDWAEEVGNPRYILDLLLSVINVSVQTVDIVNDLPKLEFER